MCWQLSIMSTLSKLITLRWRGFWRKQRVKCMMWIVHSFIKQLIGDWANDTLIGECVRNVFKEGASTTI